MLERVERATRNVPRTIDRDTHAALDYLTVAAFMIMGGLFWGRNKRATALALTNGLMVLGVSMFTDYRGSLRRRISFRSHGELDIVQAMNAAGVPLLLGMGASAIPFFLQAANEVLVVSSTDWGAAGAACPDRTLRLPEQGDTTRNAQRYCLIATYGSMKILPKRQFMQVMCYVHCSETGARALRLPPLYDTQRVNTSGFRNCVVRLLRTLNGRHDEIRTHLNHRGSAPSN
jgi:hypothetical protein